MSTLPTPVFKALALGLQCSNFIAEDPGLCAGYNRKLGVSDPAFMLISGAIDAGLGRIALMPLVVLAARLCPKVLRSMQHMQQLYAA